MPESQPSSLLTPLAPGEVRVRGARRTFRLVQERSLTLKETVLRRRRTVGVEFVALDGVDLHIEPGQAVGIVGRNGSGKSTLLKVLAGILPLQQGVVQIGGTVAALLELGSGFHPDFTGRENVSMNAALHGISSAALERGLYDEIIEFSGISDFAEMPVRTYSSGMQMRLAFAVASHVDPDVLLLDEVLAVGDEAFQRKCMGRIVDYRSRGGTLVFVSHDANAVEELCDRAVLIDSGNVLEDGPPAEVIPRYHRLLAEQRDGVGAAKQTIDMEPNPSEPGAQDNSEFELGGWGSGEIEIVHAAIRSESSDGESVIGGDSATIELVLKPHAPVAAPSVGVSIAADNGTVLFGTNTRLEGFPLEPIRELTRVQFTIPEVPFHTGNIHITVAVHSEDDSEIYHWVERLLSISVFADRAGVGIVRVQGHWSSGPAVRTPTTHKSAS